jgi:hypothetical protein
VRPTSSPTSNATSATMAGGPAWPPAMARQSSARHPSTGATASLCELRIRSADGGRDAGKRVRLHLHSSQLTKEQGLEGVVAKRLGGPYRPGRRRGRDRGVQATLGHRGRKRDPLYRIRKLLLTAAEQLTSPGMGAAAPLRRQVADSPDRTTARSLPTLGAWSRISLVQGRGLDVTGLGRSGINRERPRRHAEGPGDLPRGPPCVGSAVSLGADLPDEDAGRVRAVGHGEERKHRGPV